METSAAPEPASNLPVPVKPLKLSEELGRLLEAFSERSVSLHEVIALLGGRAYDLLLLLLALPFLLPIPIPGLSTVFGSIIAIIAARQTFGRKPWLPQKLLAVKLPPKFFPKLIGGARRIVKCFEVLLRPRYVWLLSAPLPQLHALAVFIAAFVLLLPLPPGTNFPPAACIVLFAGGLLERDGLFILCGYVAFLLNIVFFTAFGYMGTRLFETIWHYLTGLFGAH